MNVAGIPTLQTARLVLRGATRADFEPFAAMLAEPRTRYMGGPFDREGAWFWFASALANWSLDGCGGWIVTDTSDGHFLGDVSIMQPGHFPEREIGWTVTAAAEGRGIATEAARTALDWYWGHSEAESLVSYVDPANTRSHALARNLGATPDPDAPLPEGESPAETMVYRHRRPQ